MRPVCLPSSKSCCPALYIYKPNPDCMGTGHWLRPLWKCDICQLSLDADYHGTKGVVTEGDRHHIPTPTDSRIPQHEKCHSFRQLNLLSRGLHKKESPQHEFLWRFYDAFVSTVVYFSSMSLQALLSNSRCEVRFLSAYSDLWSPWMLRCHGDSCQ